MERGHLLRYCFSVSEKPEVIRIPMPRWSVSNKLTYLNVALSQYYPFEIKLKLEEMGKLSKDRNL